MLALAAVSWGTFAFGAVYPWAYLPLAIGCAIAGGTGLSAGFRPLSDHRWIFAGLISVGVVGIIQLVPMPPSWLSVISPGTDRFLQEYDLAYAFGVSGGSPATRHALSLSPEATLRAVSLLAAFALFLAGLLRVLSRETALQLAKGVTVIGVLLALTGLVQKAILGDNAFLGMKIYGVWTPRYLLTTPFGPYVNKNHFAGWMLMVIPLGLGLLAGTLDRRRDHLAGGVRRALLWFSTPDGGRTLMLVFAVLVMSLALLATRSRSGLACFVVIMTVASFLTARRIRSNAARLAIAATFVAFFGITLAWAGGETALNRFTNEPDSVQLRLRIWRVAGEIARDFPLLGTGLDTFGVATLRYQASREALHYQEAHNDYIQLLAEGGIVTAALVALTIVAVILAVRNRFRFGRHRPESYWLRIGASIGLLAIALQSAVEFSLQMPGNAVLFTVVLAIALHDPSSGLPKE